LIDEQSTVPLGITGRYHLRREERGLYMQFTVGLTFYEGFESMFLQPTEPIYWRASASMAVWVGTPVSRRQGLMRVAF
jgi:hypothetical protein